MSHWWRVVGFWPSGFIVFRLGSKVLNVSTHFLEQMGFTWSGDPGYWIGP